MRASTLGNNLLGIVDYMYFPNLKITQKKKRSVGIFLLAFPLFLSMFPPSSVYAGTSFSVENVNISNSALVNSQIPKISGSGNNVYVLWQEGTDYFFKRSTDGGSNFIDPTSANPIAAVGSSSTPNPQITDSSGNVYVVWRDGSDISFIRSNDNGVTFSAKSDLSGTPGTTSRDPQLVASGNDVYVVWREGSDVSFRKSLDGGATFVPPLTEAPTDLKAISTVRTPEIAVFGNNVYVVWRDGNDIRFIRSTDNGVTFPAAVPTDIGDRGGTSSPKPALDPTSG